MLTTDLKVPVVTETTVSTRDQFIIHSLPHLLKTVEIFTESGLDTVGDDVLGLTSFVVLLSVQEPLGDVVLKRIVDNSNDLFNFIVGKFTGTTPISAIKQTPYRLVRSISAFLQTAVAKRRPIPLIEVKA